MYNDFTRECAAELFFYCITNKINKTPLKKSETIAIYKVNYVSAIKDF